MNFAKKLFIFILIISVLLVGVFWFLRWRQGVQGTVNNDGQTTTVESKTENLNYDIKVYDEREPDIYQATANYPVVKGLGIGPQSDINGDIFSRIFVLVDQFVKAGIDRYANTFTANQNYILTVNTSEVTKANSIVSVVLEVVQTDGASTQQYPVVFNYDALDGAYLPMSEIFPPNFDYTTWLRDAVRPVLFDQLGNTALVRQGTSAISGNFNVYKVHHDQLVVVFVPGQVAGETIEVGVAWQEVMALWDDYYASQDQLDG